MRKLVKNIIVFVIPVILVIAVFPINKRFMYQGLDDDCFNHGIWIYDRIYNNEKNVQIAFLGSSHTVNGINDKLITDNIKSGNAVNFGYCRLGRNLSYVFLKEILSQKDIEHLVLEVREDEDRYSHPIFPYIANTSDVFLPNPFFNRDIIADMWTHMANKVEITQSSMYKHNMVASIRTGDYGFSTSSDTASSTYLDEIKTRQSAPKTHLSKLERDFHMSFARGYLKKIAKLCREENIQFSFLYLPSYGSSLTKPYEYKTYKKYGEVLLVPKNILDNQNYWYDEGHLNQAGASALSLWLSKEINNNGW